MEELLQRRSDVLWRNSISVLHPNENCDVSLGLMTASSLCLSTLALAPFSNFDFRLLLYAYVCLCIHMFVQMYAFLYLHLRIGLLFIYESVDVYILSHSASLKCGNLLRFSLPHVASNLTEDNPAGKLPAK